MNRMTGCIPPDLSWDEGRGALKTRWLAQTARWRYYAKV